MIRKRRWLWVLLFIFSVSLWVSLATGWDVVLVRDYHRMIHMEPPGGMGPWPTVILGSLGFAAVLAAWILFFLKVLREMKLNQLQAEFLATVSHELKTPIASIELSSSLLRSGGLDAEEIRRLWESHQMELQRLRREVEAILEAARWQAKPRNLQPQKLDLESWLNESMRRWRGLLGTSADLAREGDPLPAEIRTDPRTLDLITDNLLDNARKFSDGAPRVTIRTRRLGNRGRWKPAAWSIEFQDQGRGFDPAEAKKIFRRFFRARHDAPYSIPGTGLGLYLAGKASRALGLKLTGQSAGHGKGAVFRLEGRELRPDEASSGSATP